MSVLIAAEYPTAEALIRGATLIRETGLELVETYSPHAIEELAPPARAPVAILSGLAGLGGAAAAYAAQWLIAAYLYPINAGGRPPHMPLAFVPISVEMGFLAAATTAVLLWFFGGGMGTLWQPIDDVPGFTSTGYWAVVRGSDEHVREVLERTGAQRTEVVR